MMFAVYVLVHSSLLNLTDKRLQIGCLLDTVVCIYKHLHNIRLLSAACMRPVLTHACVVPSIRQLIIGIRCDGFGKKPSHSHFARSGRSREVRDGKYVNLLTMGVVCGAKFTISPARVCDVNCACGTL